MQGVLGNLFISYAGCVVSGGIAHSTQLSLAEINPFPRELALPPSLLGSLISAFRARVARVMGHWSQKERKGHCQGDLPFIRAPPPLESGPQVHPSWREGSPVGYNLSSHSERLVLQAHSGQQFCSVTRETCIPFRIHDMVAMVAEGELGERRACKMGS